MFDFFMTLLLLGGILYWMYRSILKKQKKHDLENQKIKFSHQKKKIEHLQDPISQHISIEINKILKLGEEKVLKALKSEEKKLFKLRNSYAAMEHSIFRYKNASLSNINWNNSLLEDTDQQLSTTVNLKLNYMDVPSLKKAFNNNSKMIQELVESYKSRYSTTANSNIYLLMVLGLEAELQNILYKLKYETLDEAKQNILALTQKYQDIAISGNQNMAPIVSKFIGEIEFFFLEAINIEYEYHTKKEQAKEEQRILREQMRQEANERKILAEQKKKIEQEELKFTSEILKIKEQIKEAEVSHNVELLQQLEERQEKIEEQLNEVEKNKDVIINLQNGKAGYVYIISNLGSFGENTFKIGMTRRLEPQDRVDELGDASVPFRFDVHSFIFSEKAPELENAIHKRFHNQRVNKINLKKEFFHCSIDELEALVYELEPTAIFNRTMLAEQYHQSLLIKDVPEESQKEIILNFEEEEEELAN